MKRKPPADSPQLLLFDEVAAEAPAQVLAVEPTVAVAPTAASVPPATPVAVPLAVSSEVSIASVLMPAVFLHPQADREIALDGHRVAYALRRARRRSIGFVVGTDGLSVNAPKWVGVGDIESALRAKAGWILRKLREQQERAHRLLAAKVDWRDGASIPFLGTPVTVRLDPRTTGAVLDSTAPGGLLLRIGLPSGAAPKQIRDAVQSWLQRQARRVFEERCKHFTTLLGVRCKRLSLSSAQTRWGSASADGSIRLNWRLIHFGVATIDYVVAHELAHLREMNHSPRFWDVVRSVMPDFEQARGTLKNDVLPVFD